MLAFDRRAARIAWTVSLVALALYAVYSVRRTLFVFVLAIFFSYMVAPLVRWVERRAPGRISHTAATAAVFTFLLLTLAGVVGVVGPLVAEQASRLASKLPELTRDAGFIDRLPLPDWLLPYRDRLAVFVNEQLASSGALAVPIARQIGSTLLGVAGNLVFVVLVPVLAFLFIKDASAMHTEYMAWADRRRDALMWRGMADDFDRLLGRYIRALLILALAAVIVYSVFLSAAGVPYGLLLATVAGALEFIPVIGPLAAAVVIVVVAGLSGYEHLLLLIGFLVLYRLFQDYVLNPYLMSDGVSIPPLAVLFGLLAGEELGGIVGIFLSVPALAVMKIAVLRIGQAVRGPDPLPTSPPPRIESTRLPTPPRTPPTPLR